MGLDLAELPDGANGFELSASLTPRADDAQRLGVRPREVLGRDGGDGPGSHLGQRERLDDAGETRVEIVCEDAIARVSEVGLQAVAIEAVSSADLDPKRSGHVQLRRLGLLG